MDSSGGDGLQTCAAIVSEASPSHEERPITRKHRRTLRQIQLKLDLWGYPVATASDACISYINQHYDQVLSHGRHTDVILKAIEVDEDCVLAHALAAFVKLSYEPAKAVHHLEAARNNLGQATKYEKMVVQSAEATIESSQDIALDCHYKLLSCFPKCLVSLKRYQVFCFYMGKTQESLEAALKVLPSNTKAPYMHGMIAFPLMELGRIDDAESIGTRGLLIHSGDPWAQHALCHVLSYKCSFKDAIEFMEFSSDSWKECCSFMYSHNWWHLALCYLEGGFRIALDTALSIYDHRILLAMDRDEDGPLQFCLSALGIFLRLHVRGLLQYVGSRVKQVTDLLGKNNSLWHKDCLMDILAVWSFVYSGDLEKADLIINCIKESLDTLSLEKPDSVVAALKLATALYNYGLGKMQESFDCFGPDFNIHNMKVIGASNEQLDVFEEIWFLVSINSGHTQEVSALMEKRANERLRSPFTWRLLGELYSKSGLDEKAKSALERAESLEEAFNEFYMSTLE